MFRHFVNILVDNPPRYPRLAHRFDLTYPQSYPQLFHSEMLWIKVIPKLWITYYFVEKRGYYI